MLPALLALVLATTTAAPAEPPAPTPTATPAATATAPALAWGRETRSPLAGVAVPAALLAALAAAAFLVTRKRAQRGKLLEVLESTSLGPRRSLVVARLGEELLVLGSSEAGIALLTTSPAPLAVRAPAPDPEPSPAPGRGLGLLARLRIRPQRAPAPVFDSLLSESMEDLELRRKLAVGQGGSVR